MKDNPKNRHQAELNLTGESGKESRLIIEELIAQGEGPGDENQLYYGAVDDDINEGILDSLHENDADLGPVVDYEEEMLQGTATEAFTGGLTRGGVSEDFTTADFSGGRSMGGPTGGDVYGAGAGSGNPVEFRQRDEAVPVEEPDLPEGQETGLAAKVAAENTAGLFNQGDHKP